MTTRRQGRSRSQNGRGFTLIEVIITIVISALAISGMLATNTLLHKNNAAAYDRVVALQEVNRVIEQMREAATNGLFPNNLLNAFPNNSTINNLTNLKEEVITIQYATLQGGGYPDPMDVSVSIRWRDDHLRIMNYSLNTLMTQRE